ncbi:unnamed protein product [Symbiodinium sp. CCMP2456]|nr:unnamed protein product [Symbiodinium sp. CCMP2456]
MEATDVLTREGANVLYRAGNLKSARAAYEALVAQADSKEPSEEAKLQNNLSVCCKALGDEDAALQHALRCLDLNPEHGLCQLRAFVLSREESHLEAAAALLGPKHPEVQPLLQPPAAYRLLKTDADFQLLVQELAKEQKRDPLVAVFCPGRYSMRASPVLAIGRRVKLLGLGQVTLTKGRPDANLALADEGGSLTMDGFFLEEGSRDPLMGFVSAGDDQSSLHLRRCVLTGAGGVTIVRARLEARDCEFRSMTNKAVEMREAGALEVHNCRFYDCFRGVSVMAKTGTVQLSACEFVRTKKEAVMLDGARPAASARAVDERSVDGRQKAELARTAGSQRDTLQNMKQVSKESKDRLRRDKSSALPLSARLHGSVFRETGWHAVACGDGVHAELVACLLVHTRASSEMMEKELGPQLRALYGVQMSDAAMKKLVADLGPKSGAGSAVHLRGGATANVDCCAFADGTVGVNVDYNFDGDILVHRCSFCRNHVDIQETRQEQHAPVRMWSKPVRVVEQKKLPKGAAPPSLSDLQNESELRGLVCRLPDTQDSEGHLTASPVRQQVINLDPGYYAVGNTFGVDVLHGQPSMSSKPSSDRAIFLGCGDIRNVLETISGWWQRRQDESTLDLLLNDVSGSVLIRDAMLLNLISMDAPASTVAECWGAGCISRDAKDAMMTALSTVKSAPWLATLSVPQWDDITRAWSDATVGPDALLASLNRGPQLLEEALKLSCQAVGEEHRAEIRRYLKDFALHPSPAEANVTLLEGCALRPSLCFSSSIFRAVGPLTAAPGQLQPSLLERLQLLCAHCKSALASGRVRIRLVGGDAFGVRAERASVVDTSNIADYVGLPNVLLLGARLGDCIRVQSMQRKHELQDEGQRKSFYKESFGMELENFEDLAALQLLSEQVDSVGTLCTSWRLRETSAPGVQRSLSAAGLAKRMCSLNRPQEKCGVAASTAMTAAALLGNLTEALETDYPWCTDEFKLLRGAGEARHFRLHVRVDMFLANLSPGAALAVAITDAVPEIGDTLEKPRSLLHLLQWDRDREHIDFVAPSSFRSGAGYASLALCSGHITCASTCGSVSDLEDRGPGPDLSDLSRKGSFLLGGSWKVHRINQEGGQVQLDVSMPRNLKGLRVDPVGQMARFTVNGEFEFEADTGWKLDSLVKAQRSTALGLACCFFKAA